MTNSYKSYHSALSSKFSRIAAFLFVIVFTCLFADNGLSGELKGVRITPFKAQYYSENDGENPGKGNDGTVKNIISKLQFTESVKRPSINFSYSDFNSINSYNFYGVWEGGMNVAGKGQSIKAHFDVSHGDVSFYVNDKLVEKWRDDSKIVQFNLNKGDNTIRVELHNHWHTTSFNVSFTDYNKLNKSEAVEVFKGIDFNSTKVVYLGAYEASSRNPGENYNEILATLPKSSEPIFVFLNSFNAVNWVVSNPHHAKIVGVALRGRSPGSTVTMTSTAPVYELAPSRNAYKSSYDTRAFIGKNADYAFTEYGYSNIIVPDFFDDKSNNHSKDNDSISPSNDSRPSQTDKYPVNSFLEKLVVKQHNKTITKTQIVKEPALDATSPKVSQDATLIKGIWKGFIEVSQKTDKSFKFSHQGVRAELIIDGRSVWRTENSNKKVYQYTFRPGRHEVVFVAYPEVDSKSAQLNVSITDNAKNLKHEELTAILKGLGKFDSIYCGVERSESSDRLVNIIPHDLGKPVVLFLTSYKQVVWDFKDNNSDKLAAIVTSSKNASESIKNLPPHIPIYHFFQLANTSQFIPDHGNRGINHTFKSAALQILALTGKLPVGFSGVKQTNAIAVPQIILDRKKYQQIGLADVSPDYNIFLEYPEKIDVVFNPVTTKSIDSKKSTKSKRLMPEVLRKSWAEPHGATEDIPTGAFKAYYFDIFNPGQPKFTGIVEEVSVRSSRKKKKTSKGSSTLYEHDIIPENFGGFWIGNIMLEKDKEMEININQGHSTTRVLIDNKVVKDRRISLKKGLHKIEIEHVNNWHTYNFSFSLSEPQTILAYEKMKEQLKSILPKGVHTAYVGTNKSKNGDNSIVLNVKSVGKPLFLILASRSPINWVIEGPGAKDIKALMISSMKSKSKIKGNIKSDVPRFHFPMRNLTYQLESNCECQGIYHCSSTDLFDTIDYIATITGRKINSFAGGYSTKSFIVPETIIDKKQFNLLRTIAQENLLALSKCEGQELSPQYLNNKQRKQIEDHASVQSALKVMGLIQDNRFDEYIQLIDPRILKVRSDGIKESFLFHHNRFAGFDPSIAYHLIDNKLYEKITTNTEQLIIPLVLKRKNLKDKYVNAHMRKKGNKWFVSYIK